MAPTATPLIWTQRLAANALLTTCQARSSSAVPCGCHVSSIITYARGQGVQGMQGMQVMQEVGVAQDDDVFYLFLQKQKINKQGMQGV